MHGFKCISLVLLGLVVNLWPEFALAADPTETKRDQPTKTITPKLEACSLILGDLALKPIGPPSEISLSYTIGDLRVFVRTNEIRALRGESAAPIWVAKAPAGKQLFWLGASDTTAYVIFDREDDEDDGKKQPPVPAKVSRLDLVSGQWLDDLSVSGPQDPKREEMVTGVLPADGHVFVLVTVNATNGVDSKEGSYRVVCFKTGEVKPIWTKDFKSAGALPRPTAFLLFAARSPDKVTPSIRMLNPLGRDILVCAGPTEDLVCLVGATGEQKWRIPRVWEYKRGFIGPSVWQHTMGRDGPEILTNKEDKPALNSRHAIVGGPIVVESGGTATPHIFVAVSKGPAKYTEYLSECVVYEFSADGRELGMVPLPRMVRGGQAVVSGNGVVWACAGGGFVRLALSEDRKSRLGIGSHASDYLCDVEWYRSLRPAKAKAWLRADPARDAVAFGPGWAVRPRSGGYVLTKESEEYKFPLSLVDLSTGTSRDMELRVPFGGRVPEPENNYSRMFDPKGKDEWHACGPHILGITALSADGDRLRVTLGMENWTRTIMFEVPKAKSK